MKAMILAAGRGERLRPLTDHTPKPLLRAGGRCLIEHLIHALVRSGFRDLVINLSYLGDRIRAHLGDGSRYGVRIGYSIEGPEPLETGGGILQALQLLGDDPFLALNGDIATDFPFDRLRHLPNRLAHLVLVPNPPHHSRGDFALNRGQITDEAEGRYTFAGIGVYHPDLFAGRKPGRFALAPLLREAISMQAVGGELYRGFWMDVGTPERLCELDRRLRASDALPAAANPVVETLT